MHTIRKPRVFLSHSKKDVNFIRRLEADLRAAQCEPWIDDVELRAGQPWLDQIFSSGIPSCEVVLCYFTKNSAESTVFKQEMDARLIERLHNARVSLLLYVANSELRSQLRLDLQRLQVPELNEENYSSMFPRLVAEIWRCYAESLVQSSIDAEKVKRLEAELRIKELESDAGGSVFTANEQAEFKAIWARINRKLPLEVVVERKPSPKPLKDLAGEINPDAEVGTDAQKHTFLLDVGILFRLSVLMQKYQPSSHILHDVVKKDMELQIKINPADFKISFEMPLDIGLELLRFGFAERTYAPPPANDTHIARMMHRPFKLMFTNKFDRFAFWIEQVFENQQETAKLVQPA